MHSSSPQPIAVIGGTGKTGRRIVERLAARSVATRVLGRATTPAFHWDDESSWPTALAGARSAYVAYAPDVAVPEAEGRIRRLAALAAKLGLERVVLLSGRGEPGALRAEAALAAAGVPWTVVRSSWFAQNFSEAFMHDDVLSGTVALPVDGVPEPFVDVEDVADVAVAALTEAGHAGEVYELTGPEAVPFEAAVAAIAAASGRSVAFVSVPLDAWSTGALEAGVPKDVVDVLRHLFGEVLDGRNAQPADGVLRAIGRPPTSFTEFARRTAATGAWA